MTLAFSEQINNRPTFFPEKIWQGLLDQKLADSFDYMDYNQFYGYKFEKNWDYPVVEPVRPKLHTIREDASNRWRADMDIHMVINNRTKNRFQFAPVVKCVSVQEIEILGAMHLPHNDPNISFHDTIEIGGENWHYALTVKVDGRVLKRNAVVALAINDGFADVWEFFKYFDKDLRGRLIHWTDLRY